MEFSGQEEFGGDPMLRMAKYLAHALPNEFVKLLEVVSLDGDLELVRTLYDAGLLDRPSYRSAVLPLALHASDQQTALPLILNILGAGSNVRPSVSAESFAAVNTSDAIHALVKLGFDPNSWMEPGVISTLTPLSVRITAASPVGGPDLRNILPILAILETLLERDAIPMLERPRTHAEAGEDINFFQRAVEIAHRGRAPSIYAPIIESLIQKDWPAAWRYAAARAVMDSFPVNYLPIQAFEVTILAGLMAKAEFDDAGPWIQMLTLPARDRQISDMAHWLCSTTLCGEKGIPVVQNMMAHGVPVADLEVDLSRHEKLARGTLLHSAIMLGNFSMVELLLESGADIDAIVSAHPRKPNNPDVGLSAFALAERHFPDAMPLLHTMRARNAIARTIRRAASITRTQNEEAES